MRSIESEWLPACGPSLEVESSLSPFFARFAKWEGRGFTSLHDQVRFLDWALSIRFVHRFRKPLVDVFGYADIWRGPYEVRLARLRSAEQPAPPGQLTQLVEYRHDKPEVASSSLALPTWVGSR